MFVGNCQERVFTTLYYLTRVSHLPLSLTNAFKLRLSLNGYALELS